jgi:hypothetical protein
MLALALVPMGVLGLVAGLVLEWRVLVEVTPVLLVEVTPALLLHPLGGTM